MPEDASSPWRQPATVASFLQKTRGAVPLTIEQVDAVLRLVAASRDRLDAFLHLGGDAVLADAVLEEFPHARGTLLDATDALLAPARHQLHPHGDRMEFRVANCAESAWTRQAARSAPFDAVIASDAFSHLPDRRKRTVFGEIFELLKPGALFLTLEDVSSATRWTESARDDFMIDAIFGEHLHGTGGKSRAEVAREYYARLAEEGSHLAPLEVQCDWMRDLGYENVDCYLKVQELAVFGGQKPAA